jgi:hypothetical protein
MLVRRRFHLLREGEDLPDRRKFRILDWAREGEVRTTEVPFRTTDAEA